MSDERLLEPKVTEQNLIFAWNFEALKAELTRIVEKYNGLVVTDETVEDSEKTHREIVSLRVGITKFKSKVKAELDKPYKVFDGQIKELLGIVDSVESPIVDQLQKYEDNRRTEKSANIKRYIAKLATDNCLDEKYVSQIVIADKWLNRTQKWSDTDNDIKEKFVFFLEMQKKEKESAAFRQEKIEMAKIMCETLSAGLATPLTFAEIENRVDSFDVTGLKEHIQKLVAERKEREQRAAQRALDAEKAKQAYQTLQILPTSAPSPQEAETTQQAPQPVVELKTQNCEIRCSVVFTLNNVNKVQFESVKSLLIEQGVEYTVARKGAE